MWPIFSEMCGYLLIGRNKVEVAKSVGNAIMRPQREAWHWSDVSTGFGIILSRLHAVFRVFSGTRGMGRFRV